MNAQDPELSAAEWKQIALIWAHMAALPVSKPDISVDALWTDLSELVAFDGAFLMLTYQDMAGRHVKKLGTYGCWHVAQFYSAPGTYRNPGDQEAFEQYGSMNLAADSWMGHFFDSSGEHRTFIREDVLGDQPWSSCQTGWVMEQVGLSDRMHSAHCLSDSVEVFLCLDRREDTPFSRHDSALIHQLNMGLAPFWARLAMSFGLYAHQKPLTPRQRETLMYLLDGYSESEIAELMGLTAGSAHQYVVAVFRALNVSSRAELMAKWMSDLG